MAFIFSATAGKKMLSERASFFVNMCNAIDNSSSCESEDDQSFMVWDSGSQIGNYAHVVSLRVLYIYSVQCNSTNSADFYQL